MRALEQHRYGPAEHLRLVERPMSEAQAGEVIVRVRAAAVDPGIWHLMMGTPWPIRLAVPLRQPRVLGLDFAGTIHAIGEGVTDVAVGDEVFGAAQGPDGSLAEFARARVDRIAPKPQSLTYEQAAAIPVSATTALNAVRGASGLKAGERVLVLGAGGGVGHFAVQLARAADAHVTAVCSPAKTELVRGLGADAIVDYTTTDPLADAFFDVIIDTAGHRPLGSLRKALTPTGRLVLVGSEPEKAWMGGLGRGMLAGIVSPFTRQRLVMLMSVEGRDSLLDLTQHVEADRLRPAIDRVFPLAEAADAIRHIGRGRGAGKTVVQMG